MSAIFESKRLAVISSVFNPLGGLFVAFNPDFRIELDQAEIKVKPIVFANISILLSILYSISLGGLLLIVLYLTSSLTPSIFNAIIVLTIVFFGLMMLNMLSYPKMSLAKKMVELDKSLLFALRHMLIKVRSGIPFFNSIAGIAYSDYGYVSSEFKKVIKQIEGGSSEIKSLEDAAFYNPSHFFRNFIWQVTNSLRAGTDISKTLEVIVKGIEGERYVQIKEFGNRLSPIALMYIMFTVILPALAVTFMTIFTFFFGGTVTELNFYVVPVILLVFNFFFVNLIKSSMPVFEME
jgi:flagellar protein FlaJ